MCVAVIIRESVWGCGMQLFLTSASCLPRRRMPFEAVAAAVCSRDCHFVHDPSSPVTSLDQLWTQASILRGVLLPKVLELAQGFGGVFPVKGKVGRYEASPSSTWAMYKGRLRMGGIKAPSRGIEKADAAYGGDVSRLLDVCREAIVFENLSDMVDCLEVRINGSCILVFCRRVPDNLHRVLTFRLF